MEIQDKMKVWVAWTNTDCTEGRGYQVPKAVCDAEATALRLGRGGSVQGADCLVSECVAVKIDGTWLAPARIFPKTLADKAAQEIIDSKNEVVARAKAAGLSAEDLKILTL